jgi:SAM-dependent methyltransferase
MQYLWFLILILVVVLIAIIISPNLLLPASGAVMAVVGGTCDSNTQPLQPLNRVIYVDDASSQSLIQYHDPLINKGLSWNAKGKFYIPPSSNKQIQTIARTGSVNDKARLLRLLCPNGDLNKFNKYISMADIDVYNDIKSKSKDDAGYEDRRADSHSKIIFGGMRKFLPEKCGSYLDIGCGAGLITAGVAKFLGLEEFSGIDIAPVENPPSGLKMTIYESDSTKLPYEDGTFDVITAIMSLHHIKNINEIAPEIVRILRPGGILYIKEHDCWTSFDAMLVDIEHAMYTETVPDYGYAYHYKNYYSWDKTFSALEYLHGDYYYTTINNEIKPTRAFYSVYRKK